MDIRNSMDGLKSLLGVTQPNAAPVPTKSTTAASTSALNSDRATVSSAGSEVSSALADSDVRTDKVAGVQAALAAGTYNVPASAVASKLVDSMLGGDRQS
jgi:negative regulator of flagellin synthesis FlgM